MDFMSTPEGLRRLNELREKYPGKYDTYAKVADIANEILPSAPEISSAIRTKHGLTMQRATGATQFRSVHFTVLANMGTRALEELVDRIRHELAASHFLEELCKKVEEEPMQHEGLKHVRVPEL